MGHKLHPDPGMGLCIPTVTLWCPSKPGAPLWPFVSLSVTSHFHLYLVVEVWSIKSAEVWWHLLVWKQTFTALFRPILRTGRDVNAKRQLLTSFPSVSNSQNWHHSQNLIPLGSVISDCNTFLALKTECFPRPHHSDLDFHLMHMVDSIHFLSILSCCFIKSLILFYFQIPVQHAV